LGDIVHFASVQFPKPEITVAYDVDANAAAAQRKTVLRAEASRILVAGAHLPFRRWTPSGSRSRLCLGASGLPLA